MVTGVSAQRRADRARGRAGRPARARPPRAVLGLPADRADAGAGRAAAAAVQARHRLAAYHLPLDAHPELGNNALLAERLGCERHEPFGDYSGRPIGRAARSPATGSPPQELFARVREVTGREPLVFGARAGARAPDRHRLGLGRRRCCTRRSTLGLDAFLTGEPREHVMADAREAGIHFIAAGHYATETFGVRALGDCWPSASGSTTSSSTSRIRSEPECLAQH